MCIVEDSLFIFLDDNCNGLFLLLFVIVTVTISVGNGDRRLTSVCGYGASHLSIWLPVLVIQVVDKGIKHSDGERSRSQGIELRYKKYLEVDESVSLVSESLISCPTARLAHALLLNNYS